mgnify:FL=1
MTMRGGEKMDQRMEISCSRCGKVRVLSAAEADADGWRASTEGLVCPCCDKRFGIPLVGPPRQTKEEQIEAMQIRRLAEKIVYKY